MKTFIALALLSVSSLGLASVHRLQCSNARGDILLNKDSATIDGKELAITHLGCFEGDGGTDEKIKSASSACAELSTESYTASDCREHIRNRFTMKATLTDTQSGAVLADDSFLCEETIQTSRGGGIDCGGEESELTRGF